MEFQKGSVCSLKDFVLLIILSLFSTIVLSRTIFKEDFEAGSFTYFEHVGQPNAHISSELPGRGFKHLVSTEMGKTNFHLSTRDKLVFEKGETYVFSFLCAAEGYFRYDQIKLWVSGEFGSEQNIVRWEVENKKLNSGYTQLILKYTPEISAQGFLNLKYDNADYFSASSRLFLDELVLLSSSGLLPERPQQTYAISNIHEEVHESLKLVELAGMPILSANKPFNDGYELLFLEELVLISGKTYVMQFTAGDASGNHDLIIYTDFNQDGDFDDELEAQSFHSEVSGGEQISFKWKIPVEAKSTVLTMRIRYLLSENKQVSSMDGMIWGSTNDICFTLLSSVNNLSGSNDNCTYFDLNGKHIDPTVSNPVGIYLRSCNGELEKIFLGIDFPN